MGCLYRHGDVSFFRFFSLRGYYRVLSRGLCAPRRVLSDDLLYSQESGILSILASSFPLLSLQVSPRGIENPSKALFPFFTLFEGLLSCTFKRLRAPCGSAGPCVSCVEVARNERPGKPSAPVPPSGGKAPNVPPPPRTPSSTPAVPMPSVCHRGHTGPPGPEGRFGDFECCFSG